MTTTAKRDIRNLLLIIFFSIALALSGTVFIVYNYGPTGHYVVKNILISPQLIPTLQFNDHNSKIGKPSRFLFSKIDFSYYNKKNANWENIEIAHDQYAKTYEVIANDLNISPVNVEIESLFNSPSLSRLIFAIETESQVPWQKTSKSFQEVDFVPNTDYFRIEIREDNNAHHWAYFYHPGIYQEMMQFFNLSEHL